MREKISFFIQKYYSTIISFDHLYDYPLSMNESTTYHHINRLYIEHIQHLNKGE